MIIHLGRTVLLIATETLPAHWRPQPAAVGSM